MESSKNINQISDIIIHVDENINMREEHNILGELKKLDGVMTPEFSKPHLIVAYYNPDKVNSFELLSAVRSEGYHAQLVGI